MSLVGQMLLMLLSAASAIGTYVADFDKHHVFNPTWSPHARFHAAAYAILNILIALLVFVLCAVTPFGKIASLQMASVLLLIMGTILFLATAVKGTSPIAGPHEKIIRKVPLALWINVAYLAVWGVASYWALKG